MTDAAPADIDKNLPFEAAMQELEAILSGLERGDLPLDDAVAAYVRAEDLRKHCRHKLENAKMSIQKAVQSAGGDKLEEFACE